MTEKAGDVKTMLKILTNKTSSFTHWMYYKSFKCISSAQCSLSKEDHLLAFAAMYDNFGVVRWLMDKGVPCSLTTCFMASQGYAGKDVFQLCLDKGLIKQAINVCIERKCHTVVEHMLRWCLINESKSGLDILMPIEEGNSSLISPFELVTESLTSSHFQDNSWLLYKCSFEILDHLAVIIGGELNVAYMLECIHSRHMQLRIPSVVAAYDAPCRQSECADCTCTCRGKRAANQMGMTSIVKWFKDPKCSNVTPCD